jgi:hypothetical protein
MKIRSAIIDIISDSWCKNKYDTNMRLHSTDSSVFHQKILRKKSLALIEINALGDFGPHNHGKIAILTSICDKLEKRNTYRVSLKMLAEI